MRFKIGDPVKLVRDNGTVICRGIFRGPGSALNVDAVSVEITGDSYPEYWGLHPCEGQVPNGRGRFLLLKHLELDTPTLREQLHKLWEPLL